MKKFIVGLAVLMAGLLFYCPSADATEVPEVIFEPVTVEGTETVSAGFTQFMEEIVCEPIYVLPEEEPLYYILSDYDKDLLVRIASLEAGNQGVEGMAHVMQVVLNRQASDNWPDTISEVIFQKNPIQFAPSDKLAQADVRDEAWQALGEVCTGVYIWNEGFYFESLPGHVWEDCHTYLFTYKGHDFYK